MNYEEYLIKANILTPGHPKDQYKNTECQIFYKTNFKRTKDK